MGRIPSLVRIFTIAAAIVALSPAAASAWMPEPAQFSRSVSLAGGGGSGSAVTAAVRTGRRFDLVALEWRGAQSLDAELRVRRASSGRWSRWVHAGASDDGPDGAEARAKRSRSFGDPVWVGGADRVQLRLARRVSGLRLRLINTTGSATAAARARTRAAAKRRGPFGSVAAKAVAPSAKRPRIVRRAAWGASRCKPRATPSYGKARVAYVHHTESVNGYSRSRAASMVLGVCLFHRNVRGWNDIGYNFLVDRYGTVYEGRAGGIAAPVLGAQAGGFNSESTGVSVIGSFTSSAPPRAAMRSLAKLLAWKLAIHGVKAKGRTKVTSAGGPSTGYPAGTRVTVNRISGHRDVDQTACPGNALYARLPALRRSVARLQGAVSRLSLGPSTIVAYGAGTTMRGRLRVPSGASPAGATVELRRLSGLGSERVLTTAVTGADGSWSAQLPPFTANSIVRAVFTGDSGRPGVAAPLAYVTVLPRIELTATPSAILAGGTVTASGAVRPSKRRVTVDAFLQRPDGGQKRVAGRTVSGTSGSYRVKLKLKTAGTYRLIARAAADRRSAAGSSAPATVVVAPAS